MGTEPVMRYRMVLILRAWSEEWPLTPNSHRFSSPSCSRPSGVSPKQGWVGPRRRMARSEAASYQAVALGSGLHLSVLEASSSAWMVSITAPPRGLVRSNGSNSKQGQTDTRPWRLGCLVSRSGCLTESSERTHSGPAQFSERKKVAQRALKQLLPWGVGGVLLGAVRPEVPTAPPLRPREAGWTRALRPWGCGVTCEASSGSRGRGQTPDQWGELRGAGGRLRTPQVLGVQSLPYVRWVCTDGHRVLRLPLPNMKYMFKLEDRVCKPLTGIPTKRQWYNMPLLGGLPEFCLCVIKSVQTASGLGATVSRLFI